jgi:hypothetical protein
MGIPCKACGESKDESEYYWDKRGPYRYKSCKECHSALVKTLPSYGREKRKLYEQSRRGIASSLRGVHGLSREESELWASTLHNPYTRCEICGIPNRMVKVYTQSGKHWILGKSFRLTLDHITPGVNDGNYRPLCVACNATRGANEMTDAEVLAAVRSKWEWSMGLRFLWWLNTSPGVGGRPFRSKRCEQRDVKFAEGAKLTQLPTVPPSTVSPSTSTDSAQSVP